MHYFKHAELVNQYHVSLKTVHNWIDAAKENKTKLQLQTVNNRTYVANTPENLRVLEHLAQNGKKYRNAAHQKTVHPRPEFYEIYSRRQILDIITNLSVSGELPRQYNYLEDGATNWDNWLKRLAAEKTTNILKGTLDLLRANMLAVDQAVAGYRKVNVIDLGVGNAYPVRELLGHLLERGILHRYVAIDISPSMLAVAQHNIQEWYGDKVKFEGHVRDISYERFDDLLVDDMLATDSSRTLNLVLLLGDTPVNFPVFNDVFKTVHSSLSGHDVLICTNKTDTEVARRYFDFNSVPNSNKLSPNHQYLLDLLNIDESLYEPEMGFDKVRMMRYIRVRLTAAVNIAFKFGSIDRIVHMEKGDTILLLRVWHMTALEIISRVGEAGFLLVHSALTKDRQYIFTVWGVETKADSAIVGSSYLPPGPLRPQDYNK